MCGVDIGRMKLAIVLLVTGAIGLTASVGAFQTAQGAEAATRTSYFANGQVQCESQITEGRRAGLHRRWSADGTLLEEGRYRDGEREGEWTYRLSDGTADRERSGIYRAGVRISD